MTDRTCFLVSKNTDGNWWKHPYDPPGMSCHPVGATRDVTRSVTFREAMDLCIMKRRKLQKKPLPKSTAWWSQVECFGGFGEPKGDDVQIKGTCVVRWYKIYKLVFYASCKQSMRHSCVSLLLWQSISFKRIMNCYGKAHFVVINHVYNVGPYQLEV